MVIAPCIYVVATWCHGSKVCVNKVDTWIGVTSITEQHRARGYPCAGFRVKKRFSLILFGSSITLAILATFSGRQVRATHQGMRPLPRRRRPHTADDRLSQPRRHHSPPSSRRVALAQMGAGRAGWYSYDFIDNGCHHSAERILPEYQNVAVEHTFPALPGVKDVLFSLFFR
jgi:hypothetical protein